MGKEEQMSLDVLSKHMSELLGAMAKTRAATQRMERKMDTGFKVLFGEMDELRADMGSLRTDMDSLRTDMDSLRTDMDSLRTELRKDVRHLSGKVDHFVHFVADEINRVHVGVQKETYEWHHERNNTGQRFERIETRLDRLEQATGLSVVDN